jgi:NifU-like protein
VPFYAEKIDALAGAPGLGGSIADADAVGISASFKCGSFVRYFLTIEPVTLVITDIKFQSDGCGYAVAAAASIASEVKGRGLSDLHGLEASETLHALEADFGTLPPERSQCFDIAVGALRSTLERFRERRVREFAGDTALICSCFGIGEDTIERAIDANHLKSVAEVSAATNAGTGCGSCRMLIQELLDMGEMDV